MSLSSWSGTFLSWETELSALKARLGHVFKRREPRETAGLFLDGLLSGVDRKTGWQMAEQAGLAKPYRMQSLLGRGRWDADALRDAARGYTIEALGDENGVLVVDDTGFLKKGTHSVGVQRQYSGTAGRIEPCQIGVFAAYASRLGHALIDRRLYLPKSWSEDAARRLEASVPDDIVFETKPVIARAMIERTLDSGVPCAWVLADAAYGADTALRRMLESRSQAYVLATRSTHSLRWLEDDWTLIQSDPATLADAMDPGQWHTLAAGEGTKGPRLYDWARVELGWAVEQGWGRWLMVRRSRRNPDDRAYYFVFAPLETPLAEMAGAAGLRWTIEECFLRAKDDLGLDHCEARSWHGWHRHMSLCMVAAAFLAKLGADLKRAQSQVDTGKANKTSPTARPNTPVAA